MVFFFFNSIYFDQQDHFFSFPMASLVTECVCVCPHVCLFFLPSNSTLFLITEHREEGEAVELILWEEKENLNKQPRNK